MANEKDRRVRKTRAQLRRGFEQLLQTKTVHDITVKELCERCDLNRSTFYLHYPDVPALLEAIERELLAEFEQVLGHMKAQLPQTGHGHELSTTELIAFLAQNAGMCRALLCHNADNPFMEKITEIVRAQFAGNWQWPANRDTHDASSYAFTFIVEGCMGMLRRWLEYGMPMPQQEMALLLRTIPARGVAALLEEG